MFRLWISTTNCQPTPNGLSVFNWFVIQRQNHAVHFKGYPSFWHVLPQRVKG